MSLLRLLDSLDQSEYPIEEVIVVDSSGSPVETRDVACFHRLNVSIFTSRRSVCVQRNHGIQKARGEWIFLCDDDIEVPPDYLRSIVDHVDAHPEAGAVTGLFLQRDGDKWTYQYPVQSVQSLVWRYVFQLSMWGEIMVKNENLIVKRVKLYYERAGNHLSKAGWPVLCTFSGEFFCVPVYSLGACVVRKDWLVRSPFDEVLDPNGIGDNYGVAMGFPASVHVITGAHVYHHLEPSNRLSEELRYFRRVLAFDYFLAKARPGITTRLWFLWSLFGNFLGFVLKANRTMALASLKTLSRVAAGNNPYVDAWKTNRAVVEPQL